MPDKKRTARFDWTDVRYFLALVRAGTLSGAARALRVNHATVARRIDALEIALQRTLFERRADGYLLTADGQALVEMGLAMERSAIEMAESSADADLSGVVRVTTVRSLADLFLVDRLASFRKQHPGIALEIITDIRVMSLARREADIAVRLGRPKDSGLVGRKLGDVHYGFYAGVRYQGGTSGPLITYERDSEGVIEAAWMQKQYGERPVSFRSNSNEAQAAAARAGFGVVMLPRYMGDSDKKLQRVDFGTVHPARELWLLSPRELTRIPRVRAVLDAITDIMVTHQGRLRGASS